MSRRVHVTPKRMAELAERGVDVNRMRRRSLWSAEEGLRHLEEFVNDMRLLREDVRRSRERGAPRGNG